MACRFFGGLFLFAALRLSCFYSAKQNKKSVYIRQACVIRVPYVSGPVISEHKNSPVEFKIFLTASKKPLKNQRLL
jgi:hypothetical protein